MPRAEPQQTNNSFARIAHRVGPKSSCGRIFLLVELPLHHELSYSTTAVQGVRRMIFTHIFSLVMPCPVRCVWQQLCLCAGIRYCCRVCKASARVDAHRQGCDPIQIQQRRACRSMETVDARSRCLTSILDLEFSEDTRLYS
jgi:hypothetical protein